MRIKCEINEVELENDNGYQVDGVIATCSKCGYTTESYGTDGPSIRRCLVLLNEGCPMKQNNFYIEGAQPKKVASHTVVYHRQDEGDELDDDVVMNWYGDR